MSYTVDIIGDGIDGKSYYAYVVYVMGAPSLGQFEQIVLTAILTLGEDAYGVTIHDRVTQLSRPRKISRGAVYATLDRMEDKGLISSWMSDPIEVRGGRARRYYRLEKSGERALKEAAETTRRIMETLAQSWKGLSWKPRA